MENKVFVRTTGKELSLLGLYAYDIGNHTLPEILDLSWLRDIYAYDNEEGWLPALSLSDRGIFRHAEEILRGVLNELPTLDQEIAPLVKNRPFDRLYAIDKAILRLGAYLIIFDRTMPGEAIFGLCGEFADLYGEPETPSYIQGILGTLAKKWRTPNKGKD